MNTLLTSLMLFSMLFSPLMGITPAAANRLTPLDVSVVSVPEMDVKGNEVSILDGDTTPTLSDHTHFGSVDVTSGTVVRKFTIYNTGSANLTLSGSTRIVISGANAADFTVTRLPSTSIAPGGSDYFKITFNPSAIGARKAVISIANNDGDENPYNFSIQGNGAVPEIDIKGNGVSIVDGDATPALSDHTHFGSISINGGMVVRKFTIYNTGEGSLSLTGSPRIVISGKNAADFTVTRLPSASIAPGGSDYFKITFNPSAAGARKATISIANNDGDENPYNFSIQGTGEYLSVAAGRWHTCALTTSGGVKCWGGNRSGQLGNGTTQDRYTPVNVSGLASGVQAISAGYYHTCALTTTGEVKCWGDNSDGQLGDDSTIDRRTPVDVSGLTSGVQAIAAGGYHTCALTDSDGVKCWGDNSNGQLGDDSTIDRDTPMDVVGLSSGVQAIAAGVAHTCAITDSGGVKCWGYNSSGQLGDGTITQRLTPVDVSGLTSGVQAIAAGYKHTCALTTTGGVKCWGDNDRGQLGDGTTTQRLTPVDVSGLSSGVKAIAAGDQHTCALTSAGGVKCWGINGYGQLGDGTTDERIFPVNVSGLSSGVQALDTGDRHTCALTTTGGVKCWGNNDEGQLGDGTTTERHTPVDVVGWE